MNLKTPEPNPKGEKRERRKISTEFHCRPEIS